MSAVPHHEPVEVSRLKRRTAGVVAAGLSAAVVLTLAALGAAMANQECMTDCRALHRALDPTALLTTCLAACKLEGRGSAMYFDAKVYALLGLASLMLCLAPAFYVVQRQRWRRLGASGRA